MAIFDKYNKNGTVAVKGTLLSGVLGLPAGAIQMKSDHLVQANYVPLVAGFVGTIALFAGEFWGQRRGDVGKPTLLKFLRSK